MLTLYNGESLKTLKAELGLRAKVFRIEKRIRSSSCDFVQF